MNKKKSILIKRTESDDILDALSLRINETLKTEKNIDDKKNNVYFWLFKFLILVVYILFLNLLFSVFRELGVSLIYYVAVSLRGIMSFIFNGSIIFVQGLVSLYIIFRNLRIFMNSTYYKRLYSQDKKMAKKKNKFFNTISIILQCLSIPYLVIIAFLATLSMSGIIMLGYLLSMGIYSISILLIMLTLFVTSYLLFKFIQNKFFNSEFCVRKKTFGVLAIIFAILVVLFGYETGSYDYNETLPTNFSLESKELFFDIENTDKIAIQSNSKYDNINIYTDNTLDGKIRVELEYFETSKVSYSTLLNNENSLLLKFNSYLDFNIENTDDVLKLFVETLRNQTLYNYNLFKYPEIKIYVNGNDMNKVSKIKYYESLRKVIEE